MKYPQEPPIMTRAPVPQTDAEDHPPVHYTVKECQGEIPPYRMNCSMRDHRPLHFTERREFRNAF